MGEAVHYGNGTADRGQGLGVKDSGSRTIGVVELFRLYNSYWEPGFSGTSIFKHFMFILNSLITNAYSSGNQNNMIQKGDNFLLKYDLKP